MTTAEGGAWYASTAAHGSGSFARPTWQPNELRLHDKRSESCGHELASRADHHRGREAAEGIS